MSGIEKLATDSNAFVRRIEVFPDARSALRELLTRLGLPKSGSILLPAYIGWSPREGSGVFDPIRELGIRYNFYRVTEDLRIDLEHLKTCLDGEPPRVLLLIHYFGYPDPAVGDAVRLAQDAGTLVVEDEAHGLFSDLVGGVCGRGGVASFFSLHKMLPLNAGGLLVLNDTKYWSGRTCSANETSSTCLGEFDMQRISSARRENACLLAKLIVPLTDTLSPLRPSLPEGVVPQTFPVVLKDSRRDEAYFHMNNAGFGVVSLYHTLISEISSEMYPDSHALSRRILNLPVHQDASPDALKAMIGELAKLLKTRG